MKNNIVLFLLVFGLLFTSCELDDNINPKAASKVPASTLFTNALIELVQQIDDSSVNSNITRLLVQYWQETTYFTESRYNFQDRRIPDNYSSSMYKDVLQDVLEARKVLNEKELTGSLAVERDNQLAQLAILEAYAYQALVDAFGDVPFTEANQGSENPTPAYDDASSIYNSIMGSLKSALEKVDDSSTGFSDADVLFNGDMTMWKKFGASLLLRMSMRIADADETAAKSVYNTALSLGVFGADEGAILYYPGVNPYVNTIYNAYVVSNRADFVPANTIIEKMKEISDPRLPLYFTMYEGDYVGAVAGLDGAQSYNNYSHFADNFFAADFPAILMDYCEIEFFMAEAASRGWSNSGSAEEHYNNAVKASIIYWGGTEEDATAYLSGAGAFNAENWKESIGTQKWIALYNRGVESWAEWRRLDFPILNVPEGLSYSDIPTRMPYPYDENDLNEANYDAAVSKMGGDNPTTKLFWDKF